ncbi:hypothetical protein NGM37_04260, partial [Streptomyces sp. TRM76130]|nr:hypothetical protein [Streptomyces sp. TRM76130]
MDVIADTAREADELRAAAFEAAGDVVGQASDAIEAANAAARAAWPGIKDGLSAGLDVVAEVSGFNDFKNCLTEGDMEACAWAAATVAGVALGGAGAGVVRGLKAGRMVTRAA